MKKEAARDYVIEIFRKYAAAGYPSYEQERGRIYREALNAHSDINGEAAVVQAETTVASNFTYLSDIAAAEATFMLLAAGNQELTAKAVKAVYCAAPLKPLHRGDITNRVTRFAVTYYTSEPQIYRRLKYARLLCAALRGLSISEHDRQLYRISEKMIVVRP